MHDVEALGLPLDGCAVEFGWRFWGAGESLWAVLGDAAAAMAVPPPPPPLSFSSFILLLWTHRRPFDMLQPGP